MAGRAALKNKNRNEKPGYLLVEFGEYYGAISTEYTDNGKYEELIMLSLYNEKKLPILFCADMTFNETYTEVESKFGYREGVQREFNIIIENTAFYEIFDKYESDQPITLPVFIDLVLETLKGKFFVNGKLRYINIPYREVDWVTLFMVQCEALIHYCLLFLITSKLLKFEWIYEKREMNYYLLLQKIQKGNIAQAELNRFIEKLIQIALRFVKYNAGRIKKITNESSGSVLEDIAVDSIVPFFSRKQPGDVLSILSMFNSWQPEITSESEAKYFLFKSISLSVNQRVNAILKEYDPFFSKILDSVNYFIKSQNYEKINVAGRVYIIEPSADKSKCWFVDREMLHNSPSELVRDKKQMLPSIFQHFNKMNGSPAAIPLYDLVYRLKGLNLTGELTQTVQSKREDLEVNEIIEQSFLIVSRKARESYVKTGKLDKNEFIKMMGALKRVGSDMMDGGINPGLYYYLCETHAWTY